MLLVSRDFVGNRSRVDRCDLLKNRLSLKFLNHQDHFLGIYNGFIIILFGIHNGC